MSSWSAIKMCYWVCVIDNHVAYVYPIIMSRHFRCLICKRLWRISWWLYKSILYTLDWISFSSIHQYTAPYLRINLISTMVSQGLATFLIKYIIYKIFRCVGSLAGERFVQEVSDLIFQMSYKKLKWWSTHIAANMTVFWPLHLFAQASLVILQAA